MLRRLTACFLAVAFMVAFFAPASSSEGGNMREITRIFWHYTMSDDVPMSTVRAWHIARGWQREGYHGLIREDGSFEQGRPDDMIGAHVTGNNADSLGFCLCGADTLAWYPTNAQYKTAGRIGAEKMRAYGLTIEQATLFHRDAQSTDCPGRLDRARLRQEILGVTAPPPVVEEEEEAMLYQGKGKQFTFEDCYTDKYTYWLHTRGKAAEIRFSLVEHASGKARTTDPQPLDGHKLHDLQAVAANPKYATKGSYTLVCTATSDIYWGLREVAK